MATRTSVGSGLWSAAGTWDGGVPVDNDTVVIAAGHTVVFDVDQSAMANGMAGVTIQGGAVTPGALVFQYASAGTYCLKIKTGTTISGTNAAVRGRILANSDGIWGNTGALPYDRKAIIWLAGTGRVVALYLDIALYCAQPTTKYVRVYNQIKTVTSVTPATDTITLDAAHGWADGTPVMITSSGSVPGGLDAEYLYYVRQAAGADLKLSLFNTDASIVDVTSVGSGTIRIYDGVPSGTATFNTLDDVTADLWTTGDRVALVNVNYPGTYDQQKNLTLNSIGASQIVVSTATDSVQYPGAYLVLLSRNVEIRSYTTTSNTQVLDYSSAAHGGVFQCAVLAMQALAAVATTFYGYAVSQGIGQVLSGVYAGWSICIIGQSIIGLPSCVMSGITVSCSRLVINGNGLLISGQMYGSDTGILSFCTTASTFVAAGCSRAVNNAGIIFKGKIFGCENAFRWTNGAGYFGDLGGTIRGCGVGIFSDTGYARLASAEMANFIDVYVSSLGIIEGEACLNGAVAVDNQMVLPSDGVFEERAGVFLHSQQGQERVGFWTVGGETLSADYAVGTHGTPPVASTYIHESTFKRNDRINWVDFDLRGVKGKPVIVTFYGKLTGLANWVTRPTIGVYDPAKIWQDPTEILMVSGQMAANTDWQTITVMYIPSYDRPLRVRMQGMGGDALGTGTEQLYWFVKIDIGGAPSIVPINGSFSGELRIG